MQKKIGVYIHKRALRMLQRLGWHRAFGSMRKDQWSL